METIRFESVNFQYPMTERKALEDVDLSVESGEFVLICGKSGCGKTTLLRQMKKNMIPYGRFTGSVKYKGVEAAELDDRTNAAEIGFVQQDPDNQIVTDKVWHELAFGLESLGLDTQSIQRRVAEMASYFNIQTWFRKDTSELSGGQKQTLNLASIMVMQPELLILDEPTSQLDPVAAADFLSILKRINSDFGTTVIISEHRLETLFTMADRVIVMEDSRIIEDGPPRDVGLALSGAPADQSGIERDDSTDGADEKKDEEKGREVKRTARNDMYSGLPAVIKLFCDVGPEGPCPLDIKESHRWLTGVLGDPEDEKWQKRRSEATEKMKKKSRREAAGAARSKKEKGIIHVKDLWFSYDRNSGSVIRGLDLDVRKGEFFCILGGNGVGKSTTLRILEGILRYNRGHAEINGMSLDKGAPAGLYDHMLAGLPQDPQALFTEISAEEELLESLHGMKMTDDEKVKRVNDMLGLLGLERLRKNHPYDLSGGEQQRLALGKILLLNPKILLLDEPTKGLDPFFRNALADILKELTHRGITILMVTHDIEFSAEHADRCAMFFDGRIVSCGTPGEFFAGNDFYTTIPNKIVRDWFPDAVTYREAVELCTRNMT
ncbi:MAG: ABC transporter ATP-binding protein [Anaerovoracaceae bacterium]